MLGRVLEGEDGEDGSVRESYLNDCVENGEVLKRVCRMIRE